MLGPPVPAASHVEAGRQHYDIHVFPDGKMASRSDIVPRVIRRIRTLRFIVGR